MTLQMIFLWRRFVFYGRNLQSENILTAMMLYTIVYMALFYFWEDLVIDLSMAVDTIWVILASILVFFMDLGFASLDAGFARSKNTVNI